jgi:TamB, inner membrane protein subunit of TAM complex
MKLRIRVLLAIVFGIVLTLYYAQYDPQFIAATEIKLQRVFQNMFHCDATCALKRFTIAPMRIIAENIVISDSETNAWHWKAQSLTFNSSWVMTLLNSRIGLDIVLNNAYFYSTVQEGMIAIGNHLKKLIFEAKDLPLFLKSLMIRKGCFEIYDPATTIEALVPFSSESLVVAPCMRTTLFITDGTIAWSSMQFIRNLCAQIQLKKTDSNNGTLTMDAEGQCALGFMSHEQDCYMTAAGNDKEYSLRIRNKTDSFLVMLRYDIEHNTIDINGRMLLAYLNKILGLSEMHIDGVCMISLQIDISKETSTIKGKLTIDNITYKGQLLGSMVIEGNKTGMDYTGTFTISPHDLGELTGDVQWDSRSKIGHMHCWNSGMMGSFGNYWQILPNELQISSSFDVVSTKTGTFEIIGTHAKLGSHVTLKGTFSANARELLVSGTVDTYPIELKATILPRCMLERFIVRDHDMNPLIHFFSSNQHDQAFEGEITYSCIRTIGEKLFDTNLKGEGILHVCGDIHDANMTCSIHMDNANIQIPQTYNFIRTVQGDLSFDIPRKKLVARDILIALHKGTFRSKRATLSWADQKGLFIHIPLLIEKVFVNMQRDLFAEVSGALLWSQFPSQDPLFKGNITIDRGECKKNIFSSNVQKNLLPFGSNPLARSSYNLVCDLSIKTKKPLHIKTSFLQTDAVLDLVLKHTLSDPYLGGSISLTGGILKFPYRDLYITRGSLYFLPHQLDDPAIELVAKGKIKKYHVTMSISGSLQNPHIHFESIPSLNEEQIITLLLAGSQEGSFALVMPAVVMQNVQTLLFDPEQTPSTLDYYFKNLLSPLKHIRIVPSFVDQTGRGGFRGAIEIDVSDQLHALIQKNFSLSEDTKFEIEYFLSDDMSVRGIKDERGDLGGEVEMRWKF